MHTEILKKWQMQGDSQKGMLTLANGHSIADSDTVRILNIFKRLPESITMHWAVCWNFVHKCKRLK